MTAGYELEQSFLNDLDKGFCILEVLFRPDGQAVDYRFLTTNAAFERQTGLSDVEGRRIRELPIDVEQAWFDAFGRVATSGKAERLEMEAAAFGRWYESYVFPVSKAGRNRVGVLFNDISERKQQEADLRRSRKMFQALVTAGTYTVFRMSADWRVLYRLDSQSLERTSDPIEDWLDKYILPEDSPEVLAAIDRAVTNKSLFELEHRVLFDDGSIGWILSRAVPLLDAEGAISEWFGASANVTERRATAEQLRKSEENLRQFGLASSDILWMRDAETLQWTYLTPAFEGIYGLSCEQALSSDGYLTWLELVVPEDRERVSETMKRVRGGERITFEYRVRRPQDGEVRWLRDTAFPITDDNGRVILIGGIGQDVTEAKHSQQQLEQSEEWLRVAVEIGKVGLWDWNVRSGEVHWSDEHYRMEGYQVGEITPSYDAWRSRVHPEDRERTEGELHRAMAAHDEFTAEFRTVHPDGTIRWLYGRGRYFYDDAGEAIRMVGAMVDTTERREWEDRQKLLVAELQHRTRNLMGVVRSISDRTARTSADLDDFRLRFHGRLEALARIQGLLSRLNEHDRVTFDELVQSQMAAANGGTARVSLSGPKGVRLRSSTVQMLAMGLHELATNAMKYGALGQPSGQLSICWSFEPSGEGGKPWLHIDWHETEVVMPPPGADPQSAGQGRELIEKALPYQLGAKTSYCLMANGIHCSISVPVSASTETA